MADLATNPRARFDYDILETVEAGIVLKGAEVKSIKAGRASIKGAYVKILSGVPWLVGASIPPYQPGNTPDDYRDQADRKLLLGKKQTAGLVGLAQAHGIALVPIRLYTKNNLVKLEVGVARGKKKHDKREAIKKKDVQRSKERGTFEE